MIVLVGSCRVQKSRSVALYFGSYSLRTGGKYVALEFVSCVRIFIVPLRALRLAVWPRFIYRSSTASFPMTQNPRSTMTVLSFLVVSDRAFALEKFALRSCSYQSLRGKQDLDMNVSLPSSKMHKSPKYLNTLRSSSWIARCETWSCPSMLNELLLKMLGSQKR